MQKILLIGGLLVLAVCGWWYIDSQKNAEITENTETTTQTPATNTETNTESARTVVESGTYDVDASSSVVNWSGKKPLIEGYTNSGTLGVTSGTITVGADTASGSFELDMNTLKVGLTAKKPNQETVLEGHLKSDRWFDVAKYPTASFNIESVTRRSDSDTTFTYDIKGSLTMKGVTNEVTFPATIYQTSDGRLIANGATEIDRTKWNITAGSGSFFDNLADNVVDDMIALSFTLNAKK